MLTLAAVAASLVSWQSATASWYGPGLYGNTTACGQTLTQGTLGVAHKPAKGFECGKKIRFLYRGRKVTVRIVDRGPYVGDRKFDLTAATRKKLRFPDGVAKLQWRHVR